MDMASSVCHFPVKRALSLLHSSPPSPAVVSFPFTVTAASSTLLRRLCATRTRGYELEFGSQSGNPANPPRTLLWEELDDVSEDEDGVDWEDLILEDTVTIIAYVKMILHSGSYDIGDQLSPEHERIICERLLPYHPESEQKIGPGIDYIFVGNHPVFGASRCMLIVRKDGTVADFSYWKCVRELVYQKYPLHADKFIEKHFAKRSVKMR